MGDLYPRKKGSVKGQVNKSPFPFSLRYNTGGIFPEEAKCDNSPPPPFWPAKWGQPQPSSLLHTRKRKKNVGKKFPWAPFSALSMEGEDITKKGVVEVWG